MLIRGLWQYHLHGYNHERQCHRALETDCQTLLFRLFYQALYQLQVVSDAIRTRETAELLGKPFSEFELSDFWYVSSGPDYLAEIAKRTEPVLYLVAHNPSVSYLASYLSGEMIQMETSSCVHLHWPMAHSWDEIIKGSAMVNFIH